MQAPPGHLRARVSAVWQPWRHPADRLGSPRSWSRRWLCYQKTPSARDPKLGQRRRTGSIELCPPTAQDSGLDLTDPHGLQRVHVPADRRPALDAQDGPLARRARPVGHMHRARFFPPFDLPGGRVAVRGGERPSSGCRRRRRLGPREASPRSRSARARQAAVRPALEWLSLHLRSASQ